MALISSIHKHISSKAVTRHIGIAIIIAFVLVTAMFIMLYIDSEQRQNQEINPGYTGGESDNLQGGSSDMAAQGSADFADPTSPDDSTDLTDPDDFIDPDNPTGGQSSDDPYDNGDSQGDPDQAQTGDQTQQDDQTQQAEPVQIAYLTFDDGPVRSITTGILDILLEEDIRATFFVLPYQGVDDLYERIIDEGHEIGNHSYSHVYERLYDRNASYFRDDILRARNFIYDNFEYTTSSFRFPGGQHRAGTGLNARLEVIRDLGYRHFHWHVDPDDWRTGRTAAEVRTSVREQVANHVRNGREHVIILMHDRYQRTLEALPGIISDLREMGFEFDIVRNMP